MIIYFQKTLSNDHLFSNNFFLQSDMIIVYFKKLSMMFAYFQITLCYELMWWIFIVKQPQIMRSLIFKRFRTMI